VRVRQQIPIPDEIGRGDPNGDRIWCAWADCDNPASGLHTSVECFAAPGARSHPELPARPECPSCRRVAFCSAGHMDYYTRSHRPGAYGKLSPGVNRRYL
jgi:hypothetical protein